MKSFVLLALACLLQSATQPTQLTWDGRAITISTMIIAAATVVNLIVAILLWKTTAGYTKTTRDIFEASHRPYVGIVNVDYHHDTTSQRIEILINIKNTGTVPAHDATFDYSLLANRVSVPLTRPEMRPRVIFPDTICVWRTEITDSKEYVDTVAAMLELKVRIDYKGAAGSQYYHKYEAIHRPTDDRFATIAAEST